jgi:uncharacterized LabA/DUF88 family protein
MKLEKINWKELGRVMVFIDAANVIYSCRGLGWHIKYENLQKYFKNHCRLVDICFYYARRENNEQDSKLLGVLIEFGFKVKVRRKKFFKNQDGTLEIKGNIDGELIVDMIKLKDQYDTAILLSGDSDFRYAIEFLREIGKRIFIFSTKYHVAKELIDASNGYINIRDLKEEWAFK